VETYEEQVARHLRAMFDDGDHPYVKDVQLEGKMITVLRQAHREGSRRDF
jgi:hypothetical protein